ncbi:hypothetical protein AMECASPLE_037764 [Ameca splendens]|uniref:Uncharacterized protein n=1 Tax=Ameca splendens TaxID=208324 RepID=A0ABV1AF21_9TELE
MPTGEFHPRKTDKDTPTQRKLHTQPRSKHPKHNTPQWQGKGHAQCQDTTEQHAHNGTPNPTSRWDKLIRQEVPQVLAAGWEPLAPPRLPQPHKHHRHCNDSPGRDINQLHHHPQLIQMPVISSPRTRQPAEQHTAKLAQPSGQRQQANRSRPSTTRQPSHCRH